MAALVQGNRIIDGIHEEPLPRAAFSASPDVPIRERSSVSTSSSPTYLLSSSTQQVIDEISRLSRQCLPVAAEGGNNGLDALLAKLARAAFRRQRRAAPWCRTCRRAPPRRVLISRARRGSTSSNSGVADIQAFQRLANERCHDPRWQSSADAVRGSKPMRTADASPAVKLLLEGRVTPTPLRAEAQRSSTRAHWWARGRVVAGRCPAPLSPPGGCGYSPTGRNCRSEWLKFRSRQVPA